MNVVVLLALDSSMRFEIDAFLMSDRMCDRVEVRGGGRLLPGRCLGRGDVFYPWAEKSQAPITSCQRPKCSHARDPQEFVLRNGIMLVLPQKQEGDRLNDDVKYSRVQQPGHRGV